MTPEQAVQVLYQMSRQAPMPADAHDKAREAALVLVDAIKPAEDEAENVEELNP